MITDAARESINRDVRSQGTLEFSLKIVPPALALDVLGPFKRKLQKSYKYRSWDLDQV